MALYYSTRTTWLPVTVGGDPREYMMKLMIGIVGDHIISTRLIFIWELSCGVLWCVTIDIVRNPTEISSEVRKQMKIWHSSVLNCR